MTIYILGAKSSFITESIEICESAGYTNIICVDNLDKNASGQIDGYPIISLSFFLSKAPTPPFICAVHTPLFKEQIVSSFNHSSTTAVSVFHKSAVLSKRASISNKGVLIAPLTVVGSHTTIDDFVLINRGALIGHDVYISHYSTIESGVVLNGFCEIGEKSYIGAGAVILPKVKIGKNCVIAAGAVVLHDVFDHCMVAGVPAVIKKEKIPGYLGGIE